MTLLTSCDKRRKYRSTVAAQTSQSDIFDGKFIYLKRQHGFIIEICSDKYSVNRKSWIRSKSMVILNIQTDYRGASG